MAARAALIGSLEPGTQSLFQAQGPKALGHPQLLSQATSRELDGKQGCRNVNRCPYVMLVQRAEQWADQRWWLAFVTLNSLVEADLNL